MKILGSLDYGQTSDAVAYHNPPRFRAFKFAGHTGDQVDAWVRSSNGGDAVAWILDDGFNVLGHNDDADSTTADAHVTATLTANTDPTVATYYVVYREYNLDDALFTVELNVKNDFFSCHTDADCVAVPARMCCPDCSLAAVNKSQKSAYQSQPLDCPSQVCPIACRLDTRVAECNTATNQCEMVEISDIACGGFTANPHKCPTGYDCTLPVSHPDVPGSCTPSDSSTSDCRQTGCASGDNCQICWGSYACVPNGAEC
jgi:hypothetical protein